ncbi:hypothetical protein [Flavicella sp.]|uniref:hypothetical protein n=1 Tax=Flavicella sp. TaxID=2957742 RepID=UPI003019BE9B
MKKIKSKINVLKARKLQINTSPLFNEIESVQLVKILDKEIAELANDLEVIETEVL